MKKKEIVDKPWVNKFLLDTAKAHIKEKITDPMPPEKQVAIMLYLYGCKEQEFADMREYLDIDQPTHLRIQNHLRDRWREDE